MNLLDDMVHDGIILDACCAITLATSGQMEHILTATGKTIIIASYVLKREIVSSGPLAVVNALISAGQVTIASPASEVEEDMYVYLASLNLDNGESVTGAIASQHNWAVATDESRAHKVFSREISHIRLLTTPDLVYNWVEVTHPTLQEIRLVLDNVQKIGRYKPGISHHLYGWWMSQGLQP